MEEYLKNLLDEKQFLTVNKNEVFIRGNKLDKDQTIELREAAKSFYNSPIWKILIQEVRNESVSALYKATNEKEIVAGQMMIFNLEIQEKLLTRLASMA